MNQRPKHKSQKYKTKINLHEFGKEFLDLTAKTKAIEEKINWTL